MHSEWLPVVPSAYVILLLMFAMMTLLWGTLGGTKQLTKFASVTGGLDFAAR